MKSYVKAAMLALGLASATVPATAQTLNVMRGIDAPHFDAQRTTWGPTGEVASLVQALPEGSRVEEVSPGRYRIDGDASPQILATVASWCAQHGVQPRNLSAGAESLSDAYWRLTEEPGVQP